MRGRQTQTPEVEWQEARETLCLDGEAVLEYHMNWPQIRGGGFGGRRISRYYTRLAGEWQRRWRQSVYLRACLSLAQQRESSRPFLPWSGSLNCELTLLEDVLVSFRFTGEEMCGDGMINRVRWGDAWRIQDGAPLPLRAVFRDQKRWKEELYAQICRQGSQRREAGDCFLDPGWEKAARKALPLRDYCLTPDDVELAFPQCCISPAVEGTPVFRIPRPDRSEKNFSGN